MHSNCPNHRRRNQEVERRLVSEACTLQNRCFMFRHSPHFPLSLALRWQVGFSIPPPEENLISTRPEKIVISSSREFFSEGKKSIAPVPSSFVFPQIIRQPITLNYPRRSPASFNGFRRSGYCGSLPVWILLYIREPSKKTSKAPVIMYLPKIWGRSK